MVSVIAQPMSTIGDFLDQFRMPGGLFSHQKERGGNAVFIEQVEQVGRAFRIGPVVETERHEPLAGWQSMPQLAVRQKSSGRSNQMRSQKCPHNFTSLPKQTEFGAVTPGSLFIVSAGWFLQRISSARCNVKIGTERRNWLTFPLVRKHSKFLVF